jgi:hypothetical protein
MLPFSGRFDNLRLDWCRRSLIEFMNAPEQTFKQLPGSDDVVKLPPSTYITIGGNEVFSPINSPFYSSTKELKDKIANPIRSYCNTATWSEDGIKVEILEPGNKWVTGKVRLRLVF